MSWVAVGVGVVGAATSVYSATKASSDAKKARNAATETGQLPYDEYLRNAKTAANEQLALNERTTAANLGAYPEYARASRDAQKSEADLALGYYPKFAEQERLASSAQRRGDLRDLGKYGAGFKDAYGQLSGAYGGIDEVLARGNAPSPLLGRLNTEAMGAGPSAIRSTLDAQARADLALGRELSPDQERQIAQASRAAYGDRGMARSNPAIINEVLARDSAAQARLRERQAFAQNVAGYGLQEDQLNHGFQLGVEGLNDSEHAARVQQQIAASSAQLGPILGAFTRTSVSPTVATGAFQFAPSTALPASVWGAGPSISGGAQTFNPLLQYGAQTNGANFDASQAAKINGANAYAAIGGGLLSTAGKVYAANAANRGGGYGGGQNADL